MAIFSKNKVAIDLQTISTLISEGSVLDGNLKAPAVARIDGHLNGDVVVEEGLILGEKGIIKGNILTKELVIHGVVEGNIQTNSLEITATGRVTGEIRTQTLVVENGAIYNGSLSMANSSKVDAKISTSQKAIEGKA